MREELNAASAARRRQRGLYTQRKAAANLGGHEAPGGNCGYAFARIVIGSWPNKGVAMQAIRVHAFGGPEALKLEKTADPAAGAGQLVLRVRAAGVNPVEINIREGRYGPQKFPFTPGNEAAGIVEAIGPDVHDFRIGDRVYTDKTVTGSYAEMTLANVENVHLLPQRATFQQGAGVGTAGGTAYRGLFQRGRGQPGDTVLVHGGTGGVGSSAIQLARAAGMTIVATSSTERGRKFVLEQGAHHAADHDVTEREEDVKKFTGGKGFDLIIEFAAGKNLASDMTAVARGGRIVIIGSHGKIEIEPRQAMSKESDLLGLMLFGMTPAEHRETYSALSAAMESGTYRPVIGLELALAEASQAHRAVMEGEQFGKIVLIP
jgi:NADPH:quinone reductase